MSDTMVEAGLVLEGGGMRGVYTAGVLDLFIDKGLYFRNCYGVSAGATQCCSYLSKQRGRAFKINAEYMKDKRYASFGNLIKEGNYFGRDFTMNVLPNQLELYDYDTFKSVGANFFSVTTDCKTGKPAYLKVEDMRKDIDKIWASCTLPILSKMVNIDGKEYLDGGVSDSIPVARAIKDGNSKVVVILTRDEKYRKKPNKMMGLIKLKYHNYKGLVRAMENRHTRYNKTLDKISEFEKQGKIFVIRPKRQVEVGRLEKDERKMRALYDCGYEDAKACYDKLVKYLGI